MMPSDAYIGAISHALGIVPVLQRQLGGPMEFKFKVCQEDLPGLPGLEKGDCVFPVASEIIEGYEYEVWHRLSDGITAKTRIEHHSALTDVTVEGSCRSELMEKALKEGDRVRYGQ